MGPGQVAVSLNVNGQTRQLNLEPLRFGVAGGKLDGDAVVLVKDLKVKGSSITLKQGTKVKSIRLVGGDHDVDCKIDGIGNMSLKSEFLKKA